MVKTIHANAYKEVLVVLNYLVEEDYNKIPKEYIEYLENNCNNDYDFKYNTSKSFYEQDFLDETKYILFGLFERYWATYHQRMRINTFKTNYYNSKKRII